MSEPQVNRTRPEVDWSSGLTNIWSGFKFTKDFETSMVGSWWNRQRLWRSWMQLRTFRTRLSQSLGSIERKLQAAMICVYMVFPCNGPAWLNRAMFVPLQSRDRTTKHCVSRVKMPKKVKQITLCSRKARALRASRAIAPRSTQRVWRVWSHCAWVNAHALSAAAGECCWSWR